MKTFSPTRGEVFLLGTIVGATALVTWATLDYQPVVLERRLRRLEERVERLEKR